MKLFFFVFLGNKEPCDNHSEAMNFDVLAPNNWAIQIDCPRHSLWHAHHKPCDFVSFDLLFSDKTEPCVNERILGSKLLGH